MNFRFMSSHFEAQSPYSTNDAVSANLGSYLGLLPGFSGSHYEGVIRIADGPRGRAVPITTLYPRFHSRGPNTDLCGTPRHISLLYGDRYRPMYPIFLSRKSPNTFLR